MDESYKNHRGAFVHALREFDCVDSFDLAIDLIIDGNFEVAHEAFMIIDEIDETINGDNILVAYDKLNKFLELHKDSEDWRVCLINDALELFV